MQSNQATETQFAQYDFDNFLNTQVIEPMDYNTKMLDASVCCLFFTAVGLIISAYIANY